MRARAAPAPESFRHQPFYCEENVYHLCQEPIFAGRPRFAAFLSNASGGFAMWGQKASPRPGRPILWDYHVILLAQDPWEIWDLDTTLGFPLPAADYLRASFPLPLPEELMPCFRLVPPDELAATFASDRRHMRRADGRYRKPPPPWPPIVTAEEGFNLPRFLDVNDPFAGEVLTLDALRSRVSDAGGASAP
ncbi:MAG: hypothetical protein U0359_26835 [Byssovorax sp.]